MAFRHGRGGGYAHGAGYQRREFYIVSEMHGKVVDIKGESAAAGTNVIVYKRKSPPAKNQLWYADPHGFIRSALNDMTFHSTGKGHDLKMQLPLGDAGTQWRWDSNKVLNGLGECLDIKGESRSEGAVLCAYDYKNQGNQHWRLEYA